MGRERAPCTSMTMTFGVGAWRNASMAAAPPPMRTLTRARCIRRSSAAASIMAAVSGDSQKAWIVIRGTGAITRSAVSLCSAITALSG